MTLWSQAALLANISVRTPVEAGEMALVPANDIRIRNINKAHPINKKFVNSFRDAFGVRIRPSIIIINPDSERKFSCIEALASFRDVISASVVLNARARSIRYRRSSGLIYSNIFDIYPWNMDKFYRHITAFNPSMIALHDPNLFRGQSSPDIPNSIIDDSDIDHVLLDGLIRHWRACYSRATPPRKSLLVMRSLNMMHRACQLPGSTDSTQFDFGRMIGLWISAFEILVHSGIDGGRGTGLRQVVERLESANWIYRVNRLKNLVTHKNRGQIQRRSLPAWLYHQLYDARNAYLHGNDVQPRHFLIPSSHRRLADFASPLYRCLLTSELGLNCETEISSDLTEDEISIYYQNLSSKRRYRRLHEEAIAVSRGHDPKSLGRIKSIHIG